MNARLPQVDALRGIAALGVVLFHYTTRYQALYGHTTALWAALPWGHLGVNLFFMISGFVIFLTLQRTQRPMDFIVSRFSRLYPAYWLAVGLTFAVVHGMGLPGKEVSAPQAVLNLTMLHGLFNVPSVDNVYWTLQVELLFYAGALLLFQLNALQRIHLVLALLLLARLAYHVAQAGFGVDLPWALYRLFILNEIAWFACGIMVFRLAVLRTTPRPDGVLLATAVAVLGVTASWGVAALAAGLAALLYGAATQRLKWLNQPLLLALGAVSYSLYLLHENIGWVVIRRLEHSGVNANLAVLAALAVALALAAAVRVAVEKPAMRWLRARYQRKVSSAT